MSLGFQFVPFRDYIDRSGNQVLSMARLAKDVLAEIPDQLLSFMKSRGIEPRPALTSSPLPGLNQHIWYWHGHSSRPLYPNLHSPPLLITLTSRAVICHLQKREDPPVDCPLPLLSPVKLNRRITPTQWALIPDSPAAAPHLFLFNSLNHILLLFFCCMEKQWDLTRIVPLLPTDFLQYLWLCLNSPSSNMLLHKSIHVCPCPQHVLTRVTFGRSPRKS